MKRWKRSLGGLLIAAVFAATALPHAIASDETSQPTVSAWAQEEIQQAQELGLIPDYDEDSWAVEDYTAPITRSQYVQVAMEFVALQQHCDRSSLEDLIEYYFIMDEDGYFVYAFTDANTEASLAYSLGIVEGRGNGIFDPEGLITRQEAAVVLTRAYQVCGGTLPEETGETSRFTDEEEIAGWAKESASALATWDVMEGMEDGTFAPEENYTVEQCIVTFLRLYENAPVSWKNDNVTPLFTYEQVLNFMEGTSDQYHEVMRLEGPYATFMRIDVDGMMGTGPSYMCFVYRDGGLRVNRIGSDDLYGFTPTQEPEDPYFSEDGKTFYFTITVQEDTFSYYNNSGGDLLYEKGIYHITVDVDTGKYQVQREDLPE